MTTPLASEPMAGDGQVPYMSTLVDRLYHRLPEVYRTMDGADDTWPFKRYLGGVLTYLGEIDDTILRIAGSRPVGPATPEPWGLPADELAVWRDARLTRWSALGDPLQADEAWLPWMAQLVGARLDPAASEAEQRDTIRYATSGWRGGTRSAIEDAARSALTGTRYVRVVPHSKSGVNGLEAATIWDIAIVTRTSETPDPNAVLGAVIRKGVKPAGAVLWHLPYGATWDQIEARFPTWYDIEAAGGWTQVEEAGLAYVAVLGNLLSNPSFEVNATGWAARGAISTIGRIAGGVDGVGMCRITTTAAGTGEITSPTVTGIVAGTSYQAGFSARPDITRNVQFTVEWYTAGDVFISAVNTVVGSVPNDTWARGFVQAVAPATAAKAKMYVQVTGMALGEFWDLDAAMFRSTP